MDVKDVKIKAPKNNTEQKLPFWHKAKIPAAVAYWAWAVASVIPDQ